MPFIEQFLRKTPAQLSEKDISDFVGRRIQESLNLDYKDIKAYHDPDHLSKIVSSFANSAGGLLLLGVSEEDPKHKTGRIFPQQITWGDPELSRETLEDRLFARIHAKTNVIISPVRRNGNVIFLIDVPASDNPPHMAFDYR